jgi:stage II sporulation protein D
MFSERSTEQEAAEDVLKPDRYAPVTALLHALLTRFVYFADWGPRHMRRLPLLAALITVLALAGSAVAAPLFVVTGRGWGHGVGMSQWGAYALAQSGWNYGQILGYYYPGTSLVTMPSRRVSVLLADNRLSVRIGSTASFKVGTKTHAAGSPLVRPTSTGRILVEGFAASFPSPLTFSPSSPSAPLRLNGGPYRGVLSVFWRSGRLRIVNRLPLENYVKGVVPRESPSSWPFNALAAQADAARSYALATGGHCGPGLFCADTRDQVYGGVAAETPSTNAAVDATRGQVVSYGGAPAQTFFHSSSGGRTASSADVWGGSVPYLQSRQDYDLVPENPNRYWKKLYSASQMATRLGTRLPSDMTVTRNSSGRARSVSISTAAGSTSLPGSTVQSRLGLKSTRFWIGVLSIVPARTRSVCGRSLSLAIIARGVGTPRLQQRPTNGTAWQTLAMTNVGPGRYTATRRPCVSTFYRLASTVATGASVRVLVSPAIAFNLSQPADGSALTGTVKPKLTGTPVSILRRRSDGTWATVATAAIDGNGAFRARFRVTSGTYRARVVPPSGSGLVTGLTAPLVVTTG